MKISLLCLMTVLLPGAALAEETVLPLEISGGPPRPGATLVLSARGFAPGATVEVGWGPPASEYRVIAQTRADAQGAARYRLTLDKAAPDGLEMVLVLATEDYSVKALSNPLTIGGQGGEAVAALSLP